MVAEPAAARAARASPRTKIVQLGDLSGPPQAKAVGRARTPGLRSGLTTVTIATDGHASWVPVPIRYRSQPPSLARIATELGLSPTNMSRSFHKHFGCTLGEYLRMARVTMAAEELSSSPRPLAEVALPNGFSDQSHTGRLFRLHLGVTPAAYRDLARVS